MLAIFRPLKDRAVTTMWSGLAASTIGEDVFRVAVVWLAVEAAGNLAALVNAAQYGAMFVVGLLGSSIIDRWRPERAMVGAKLWSAALAILPVAGYYIWGVSIPLLVLSVMGLAGLRMVFTPALQSTVPTLVRDRTALQAVNGLFDATWRLARLVGPIIAALLELIVPVIHFLSVTALGFLLSGLAVHAVRQRLVDPDAPRLRVTAGLWGAFEAVRDGARLILRERIIGMQLVLNALVNGPWSVALQLAIALMVKEHDPRLFGIDGLAAYAFIMGACGVGDVSGNLVAGSARFKRPLSTMFLGYVAMGAGFALLAVAAWTLPPAAMLPAMMLAAAIAGFGGPFFFIPMVTRMQTAYRGAEIARVFRLRLVVMAGSMLFFNLSATWFFEWFGATTTELMCGLLILAVGIGGYFYCRRLDAAPSEQTSA
ncbi:MAG: MFS transporter [Rhodospirillales bacterium]|nr:MAG: MFS transporter [Rhodospirillales bacterium]